MNQTLHDSAEINWLPDGKRLSMRHGPIDLIVEAGGAPQEVEKAYRQAAFAFRSLLTNLVLELDVLRKPLGEHKHRFQDSVANHMQHTAQKIAGQTFATPMIAVAGAVADHILQAMNTDTVLERAYVNNGGDIALHLSSQAKFDVGICSNIETGDIASKAKICADDGIGGIATSGWRGRSHSLGIADAVTVFASDAATADTAATLIANAIDLPQHAAVRRVPANELSPDSDLGNQLVTVAVADLSDEETKTALCRGQELASAMFERGDIKAVYANLNERNFCLVPSAKGSLIEHKERTRVSAQEMAYA